MSYYSGIDRALERALKPLPAHGARRAPVRLTPSAPSSEPPSKVNAGLPPQLPGSAPVPPPSRAAFTPTDAVRQMNMERSRKEFTSLYLSDKGFGPENISDSLKGGKPSNGIAPWQTYFQRAAQEQWTPEKARRSIQDFSPQDPVKKPLPSYLLEPLGRSLGGATKRVLPGRVGDIAGEVVQGVFSPQPMTADELAREPFWMQALNAIPLTQEAEIAQNALMRGISRAAIRSTGNIAAQQTKQLGRTALETTGPALGIPKQELRTAGMAAKKKPPAPSVAAAAKEPWQITKAEFGTDVPFVSAARTKHHKIAVERALSEGKPVPAEVLAEYPDLAAKAAPSPETISLTPTKRPPQARVPRAQGVTGAVTPPPAAAKTTEPILESALPPKAPAKAAVEGGLPPVEAPKAARTPNVYHGTGEVFDAYSVEMADKAAYYGPGVYFTDNSAVASSYAMNAVGKQGKAPNVRVAQITPKKPFDVRNTLTVDELRNLPPTALNANLEHYVRRPIDLPTGAEYYDALVDAKAKDLPTGVGVVTAEGQTYNPTGTKLLTTAKEKANQALRAAGYDVIIYPGGKATGGVGHTAYVVLDEGLINPPTAKPLARTPAVPPFEPPKAPVVAAVEGAPNPKPSRVKKAVDKPGLEPLPDDLFRKLTGEGPPTVKPPSETTAAVPPPKGKRLMSDLTDFETARVIATTPDGLRYIANLPGVRAVAGILNPSSVANSPVQQAIVTRAALRSEGHTKAVGAFQTLAQLGSERKVFGEVDEMGRLTSEALQGVSLNDIRSNPTRYAANLTDSQKAWIEAADVLEREKLDLAKRNGIKINELSFEEGGRYAGRRVFAKLTPEGELLESAFTSAGPGRPGAKLGLEKQRVFKTAEDAINNGFRYLPEEDALFYNMVGMYNRVADKKTADWMFDNMNWRGISKAEGGPAKFGEAAVNAPAFAGKVLTGPDAKEIATLLNKSFTPEFNQTLGAINKVNSLFRFFRLAGDASPMMIQLLILAGDNPKIWGKAGKGFVQALFDTQFHARYLAKQNDLIQRSPGLILAKGGNTEFTEALARGGLLRAKPLKLAGKVLEPFQRGFDAALDVAGIEMRGALDHLATTPERTAQVDAFVNELRGLANSASMGVSPLERQLETAAFLAPRYNRAIAALLTDTVRGNLRGQLARKALAKGVTAIVAMSIAVSYARGEDEDEIADHLNPGSPNFLTWNVGNSKVGPGTKVRSVLKLWAAGIKDPDKLIDLNPTDRAFFSNPLVKFTRGNLSPIGGDGLDILIGRNYIGDPTRDNWQGFGKTIVAPALMPIWVQSVAMDGGTLEDRATRGAAEFFGLRSYASNPVFEARQEWESDIAQYESIPTDYVERRRQGFTKTRDQLRGINPELDAKLFMVGDVDSLKTDQSIAIAARFILERNVDPMEIRAIKRRMEERQRAQENGIALSITNLDRLIGMLSSARSKAQPAAAATETPVEPALPIQRTPRLTKEERDALIIR